MHLFIGSLSGDRHRQIVQRFSEWNDDAVDPQEDDSGDLDSPLIAIQEGVALRDEEEISGCHQKPIAVKVLPVE